MNLKHIIPLALVSYCASFSLLAKESLTISYKEADAAFERLSQETNTMGIISYCQLRDKFPSVNEVIKQKIVSSFDESLPQEDRQARTTLLFSMVNMYAGGVAHGLSMSHTLDNSNGPDKKFCELSADVAKRVFPSQGGP